MRGLLDVVDDLVYLAMGWPLARPSGVLENRLRAGAAPSSLGRRLRRITRQRLAGPEHNETITAGKAL